MTTRIEAAREILAREGALGGIGAYRGWMAGSHLLDFRHPAARHHLVMIDALERLERGEIRRLLITAPPGSAKSTYVSVQFATWYLARHVEANILCCSNTTELAETFNRRRRSTVMTKEWSQLSGTKISANEQGVGRFSVEAGGSVTAAGVGSAIVGLRSEINVLDDPVKSFEESMSTTQLRKIWDWYVTEFRSRLIPTGKEVVVTTRWAKNDPAGRILQAVANGEEEWTVIRLPMLCDSDEDPLGRVQGEPLWPQWFEQKAIERSQRDPLIWSAMYQQTPLDESGSWVPLEHIHVIDQLPERQTYITAIDLALSVGRGDYSVIGTTGIDEERNINIADVFRKRISPEVLAEEVFKVNALFNPRKILIDDDPAAKVFLRLLLEMARQRNIPLPLQMMPLRGRDKETRAAAIRGFFLQDRVRMKRATWNTDLIREITEFPSGTNDDQIDFLSLIGRELVSTSSPMADRPRIAKPIEYAYVENAQGQLVTRQTMDELFEDAKTRAKRRWRV